MSFSLPRARFHQDHNNRDTTPGRIIRINTLCFDDDCSDGAIRVRVEEVPSGAVLARGRLTCSGQEVTHDLAMVSPHAHTLTNCRIIFECGTREREGATVTIWVRNEI